MIALAIALFSVFTLCAGDISLPAPQKNGGMTLTETLASSRSVRKYTAGEVSMQALANVLWCANGISSPDGKRTAPSAMNRQEIIIYVTMKSGSFRYDAATHKLVRVSDADLRPQAGRYAAPVYLLLVADTQRQRSEIYAAVDTGYVSQNIYLGATANSLGTCAMGSITDRKKISEVLQLGKNRLMLSHPLGTPEK
jgi:nitroreductase